MAQREYRVSVTDAAFPLLSENQGRTVIGATSEEIYTKNNKPGLYYCHNVMPTAQGLDSVGYKHIVTTPGSITIVFSEVKIVYSTTLERVHIGWTDTGDVYALGETDTQWRALPATTPAAPVGDKVTVGRVNGITYIFYAGLGCFTYDSTLHQLVSVTLTGITLSEVLGITATSGYLVIYSSDYISWSSTIDPTDFIPSQTTGAGGGKIASIGGDIKFVTTNSLGLLIYSDTNVIAGVYSGNTQYPFKFNVVQASRGGIGQDLVAYESNTAAQFAYTKAGLQTVNSQEAAIILPNVTDFLGGKRLEDFDEATKTLTTTELTTTMQKRITFVASRYLVISYGSTSFTHALIYDVALERLGKLKLDHTYCFEYVGELAAQVEVAKESIAFVAPTGEVSVLDFSTTEANVGVALLGKLQYTKSHLLALQEVAVENVREDAELSVSDLYSLDGKNTISVDSYLKYTGKNLREYSFHTTAINHTLQLVGQFNLNSVLITYTLAGRR